MDDNPRIFHPRVVEYPTILAYSIHAYSPFPLIPRMVLAAQPLQETPFPLIPRMVLAQPLHYNQILLPHFR